MTKPVTELFALMKLYEEGKFQLDDPLSKYAPEFANLKVFAGYDKKGKMIYGRTSPACNDQRHHTPHRRLC